MTYCRAKTFLEVMEEGAAAGNPACIAFLRKQKVESVSESCPVKKYIAEVGLKYLPPIDPKIEAEIEAGKKTPLKPLPTEYPPFDPDIDDGIPF
jgi:hypothetical protein